MPWGREFKAERVPNRDTSVHNYQMDIKVSQVVGVTGIQLRDKVYIYLQSWQVSSLYFLARVLGLKSGDSSKFLFCQRYSHD